MTDKPNGAMPAEKENLDLRERVKNLELQMHLCFEQISGLRTTIDGMSLAVDGYRKTNAAVSQHLDFLINNRL